MKKSLFVFILCCAISFVGFTGCQLKQDLPDAASIQDKFDCNEENITLVTEYLLALSYPDAWIHEPNRTFFLNLNGIQLKMKKYVKQSKAFGRTE